MPASRASGTVAAAPRAAPGVWPPLLSVLLAALPRWAAARPGAFKECADHTELPWPPWLDGWPGGCLVQRPNASTANECRRACTEDVQCPAWRYDGEACLWAAGCCTGAGAHSVGGGGEAVATDARGPVLAARPARGAVFLEGGLVLHGEISAQELPEQKELSRHYEVRGLLALGPLGGADAEEDANRCKLLCYVDTGCGYWQYGNGSCRVERAPHPVFSRNVTKNTPFAALVVAGEQVMRGCPHDPHPAWLVFGLTNFSLGLCAILWAISGGTGPTREMPLKRNALAEQLHQAFRMPARGRTAPAGEDEAEGHSGESASEENAVHPARPPPINRQADAGVA